MATKFERSLALTKKLRSSCAKDMRPLFDHSVKMAQHSHKVGYFKRAGIELRHARKVAKM